MKSTIYEACAFKEYEYNMNIKEQSRLKQLSQDAEKILWWKKKGLIEEARDQ